MSVILADGDGRRVVVADAQGPVLRVVYEDGAVGAELVDQSCRIRRSGQLGRIAVPVAQFADAAVEQDGEGGQVGRIWSSRTCVFSPCQSLGGWRWCGRGGVGRRAGRWTRLKSASLTSAACAGCLEMTQRATQAT